VDEKRFQNHKTITRQSNHNPTQGQEDNHKTRKSLNNTTTRQQQDKEITRQDKTRHKTRQHVTRHHQGKETCDPCFILGTKKKYNARQKNKPNDYIKRNDTIRDRALMWRYKGTWNIILIQRFIWKMIVQLLNCETLPYFDIKF
jgi:hypothetical protein